MKKPHDHLNKWFLYDDEFVQIKAYKKPYFALRGYEPGIIRMHEDKVNEYFIFAIGDEIDGHVIKAFQYYRNSNSYVGINNRIVVSVGDSDQWYSWTIDQFKEQFFKQEMKDICKDV